MTNDALLSRKDNGESECDKTVGKQHNSSHSLQNIIITSCAVNIIVIRTKVYFE